MPYITSWERIAKKDGIVEGKKVGIEKGKKEGKKEGKWDVVKNSLKEGLPIKTIERITGFSMEEISQFKKNLSHSG